VSPRSSSTSLRTALLAIAVAAIVYVAFLGVVIAVRLRPATAVLRQQSEVVLAEFQESTRRVRVMYQSLSTLWDLLERRRTGVVPLDSLEQERHSLQGLAESSGILSRLISPAREDTTLRRILGGALADEARLRNILLAAIGSIELGEVARADILLRRADALDAPLSDALARATIAALQQVTRHEENLDGMLANTTGVIWAWFLGGVLVVPLLAVYLRRRLFVPLARLDDGLDRIAAGQLDLTVPVDRPDEVGRLTEHFNRTAVILRQRAEEEEQRAEDRSIARTRMVLDAALDAVIVADKQGVIREWSPQAEAVFGWSRSEALDRTISELIIPEEARESHRKGLARYATTGEARILGRRLEFEALRRDGTRFPIEITVTPLTRGSDVEYSAFIRDITERHRAEEAIAASEERYRTAFEQAAVGMVELGLDGRYLRVNRAFAELVGRTKEDVIGRHYSELTHRDDHERDDETFLRVIHGEASVRRQKRYRRPDGGVVTVDLTAALVRDPQGTPQYALTVVQDVTAEKRLEEQLRQAHKMDAVGQLAGGVAHDFNNILTAIIGFADLLRRTEDIPAEVKDDAGSILATAERGADLARNLLTLSRAAPPREEGVDLHDVIAEVRDIATRTFDRRITIRIDRGSFVPAVTGDKSLLLNAILNLALNARDAMPDGGVLTIRTRDVTLTQDDCERLANLVTPGPYVAVSVIDTGKGMSPQVRERIFEPFFTTKPAGKGTGIGLAMVYGTVRSHGGAIEVHSTEGHRTEFDVYLPSRAASVAQQASMNAEIQRGSGRILLADDEAMVRDVAARMLRRLGYEVDVAIDGVEAVSRVTANGLSYDLIILDGNMPRMTGQEAALLIRQAAPSTPVLLATGYLEPDQADRLGDYGFSAAITKPYNLAELSRAIARQLREAGAP